jgi:hypothetical protein
VPVLNCPIYEGGFIKLSDYNRPNSGSLSPIAFQHEVNVQLSVNRNIILKLILKTRYGLD